MTNFSPFEYVSLVDEPNGDGFSELDAPPRMWTEAEMRIVREEAEAAGFARAAGEARQSSEACIAKFLETLTSQTRGLADEMAAIEKQITQDAVTLARALAYKIAGEALHSDPLSVVVPVIETTLKQMTGPHRLNLTVHEILKPAIESRTQDLAEQIGFEGGFHVSSGASHMADCSIEWTTGGIARDHKGMMAELDRLIAAHGHPQERWADEEADAAGKDNLEFDFTENDGPVNPSIQSGA